MDYLKKEGRVYNNSDFYDRIGKNRSQMCDTVKFRRPVTRDLALLVEKTFPEINSVYLIEKNCAEMLRKSPAPVIGDGNNVNNGRDQNINTTDDRERLLAIIEKQQEQIDTLIKMLASK